MKNRTLSYFALSLLASAALVGCSSTKLDEKPPVESRPVAPTAATTAQPATSGMGENKVTTVDLNAQYTQEVASQRAVYFDFDSYTVKDDYRGLIEAHAKRLNYNKGLNLRLEGNTDERGGSEYNLALGQKRAEAVVQQMKVLGVGDSQLEAVSYGKERPMDAGHTEAAWAKNRRVDLKDK